MSSSLPAGFGQDAEVRLPRKRFPGEPGAPARAREAIRRRYARFRDARLGTPCPMISNANGADEAACNGAALLVYLPQAFQLADDDPAFLRHQNLNRCRNIAAVLGELGCVVDVVHRSDTNFRPARSYDLVIGDRTDWNGVERLFPPTAVHVYLATSMSHHLHNANLRRRHELLRTRRGCDVEIRRVYPEVMPAVDGADAIAVVGNDFTARTWKEVFEGPVYPFHSHGPGQPGSPPKGKDFAEARRSFLFFASKSQMQKGLDLLLEIFPRHPSLQLYVCSRFEEERDFCACYRRELFETPNVHPLGWVGVRSPEFDELMRRCAYVIHPTCSEGQPGSVVQCMYAGLIPLITEEAAIDPEGIGVRFADDSLEEIERVIADVTQRPPEWHLECSARTRAVAQARYSERAFVTRWREIMELVREAARAPA